MPGFKKVVFNFRYSPASTEESLMLRMKTVLDSHSLNYEIDWHEVCKQCDRFDIINQLSMLLRYIHSIPSRYLRRTKQTQKAI